MDLLLGWGGILGMVEALPSSPPFATILKAILCEYILVFFTNKNKGEEEIFQVNVQKMMPIAHLPNFMDTMHTKPI